MNARDLNTLDLIRGFIVYCQYTAGATDLDTPDDILMERISGIEDNAEKAKALLDVFIAKNRKLNEK